jgi:hypothetical protein
MIKILSLIAVFGLSIIAFPEGADTREAILVDKIGDVCCEDEKARLDNFAVQLQNDPQAHGYIIFYGGKQHHYPSCQNSSLMLPRRGEAEARVARMKPYLVDSRGIRQEKVTVINGGYRKSFQVDLWLVPKGVIPPLPTPTVEPREIKFREGEAQGSDYDCEV